MSRPAAVDRQGCAGDRLAARTAQEHGERAQLGHVGETLVWLRREQDVANDLVAADAARLCSVLDLVLDQRRPDVPWANGVAGDAVFGAFERQGLGQPDYAVLGGDVRALEWRRDEAMRGGDVDNPAVTCLLHRRER